MRKAWLSCAGDTRMPARLALGSHEFDQRLPQMVAPMSNDAILWGIDKKTWPELYQLPLWQLGAETERLRTLSTQGSRHAKHRLNTIQRIFDERAALEEAVWKQRNNHNGGGDVHYHNTVTVPQAGGGSTVSPVAAFGIGASLAAVVFFALSGLAVLVIVGLVAALLISAAVLVAVLLHRRDKYERYTQPVAPQFTVTDTLQPFATAPTAQAIAAENQDIHRLEHKPVRAITAQKTMEATPLVRKSSAVSTVTSKAVKVRR
jgi:hypothetical protein